VPIPLQPHGRAELVVDERQGDAAGHRLARALADEAVKAYLADSRADRGVAQS